MLFFLLGPPHPHPPPLTLQIFLILVNSIKVQAQYPFFQEALPLGRTPASQHHLSHSGSALSPWGWECLYLGLYHPKWELFRYGAGT